MPKKEPQGWGPWSRSCTQPAWTRRGRRVCPVLWSRPTEPGTGVTVIPRGTDAHAARGITS